MTKLGFSSLRIRLLIIIVISLIPAFILNIYTTTEIRRISSDRIREEAILIMQPVSIEYESQIGNTRQLLSILSRLPEVRNKDSVASSAIFADVIAGNDLYANIGFADINGDTTASGLPLKGVVNISDREYFQRTIRSRSFSVGEFQIGRVSHKASIAYGYPVFNGAGKLQGIIFASIDISWFERYAARANLPQNPALLLIDDNGRLLVRYPDSPQMIGKFYNKTPLVKTILSRERGTLEIQGLDGVRRIYAFTLMYPAPITQKIYLAIGIPVREALARANIVLIRNLTLLGLVSILILIGAWILSNQAILHRINILVSTTNKLGSGDLRARTGLLYRKDELGQLAHSLDEMGEKIETLTRQNQEILNSAGEGIYGIDSDGNATFINPAAANMLGWKVEELIGKHLHDVIHYKKSNGEPYKWEDCPIYSSVKYGTTRRGSDETYFRKDGSSFPIEYVSAPIRNGDEILGAVEIFEDITIRKRTEEALRLDESRLEALLSLSQMTQASVHDIADFAMEEGVRLTKSRIGYIAFVADDQKTVTMYAWSEEAMLECAIENKPIIYHIETMGLWGEALRQRKPIITNDYPAPNPLKRGYPEGHIGLTRHMNVPVIDGGKVVVIAGVGNKDEPYDETDVRQLILLMDGMWKIIQQKQANEAVKDLNRTLRMITVVNQILIRAAEEQSLLINVCQSMVEKGDYRMVWIGYAGNDPEKSVRPVCHAGFEEGYLSTVKISWADNEYGRGPTGTAIRSGKPSVLNNIQAAESYGPWKAEAGKRGYASSVSIPLITVGQTLGTINLYSGEVNAFDEDEINLLIELANDIAYGIQTLRTRKALRESEKFVQRIADTTPDFIYVLDIVEKRFVYFNQRITEYLGTTPDEMKRIGYELLLKFVHPEDTPLFTGEKYTGVKDGEIVETEFRVRNAGGELRWMRARNVVFTRDPDGSPRQILGTSEDITEHKLLDEHKRDFYRRTILAATNGKLIITDIEDIERLDGTVLQTYEIRNVKDLGEIRTSVRNIAESAGMEESRIDNFVLCVGESTTNAVKHAKGGTAELRRMDESLLFVVTDHGPGIEAINLPELALKVGYTTAVSLGIGYKVMISVADNVYLATGPGGTTVAIRMAFHLEVKPPAESILGNIGYTL